MYQDIIHILIEIVWIFHIEIKQDGQKFSELNETGRLVVRLYTFKGKDVW